MNTITIELCAEDRARQDKIIHLLEQLVECDRCTSVMAAAVNAVASPATAPEAPKAPTQKSERPQAPVTEPSKAETPTAAEFEPVELTQETAPWGDAPTAPAVTIEQIQQKVLQLASGSPKKKAAVRAIINTYAEKVSALPADAYADVWTKLTALEREG